MLCFCFQWICNSWPTAIRTSTLVMRRYNPLTQNTSASCVILPRKKTIFEDLWKGLALCQSNWLKSSTIVLTVWAADFQSTKTFYLKFQYLKFLNVKVLVLVLQISNTIQNLQPLCSSTLPFTTFFNMLYLLAMSTHRAYMEQLAICLQVGIVASWNLISTSKVGLGYWSLRMIWRIS